MHHIDLVNACVSHLILIWHLILVKHEARDVWKKRRKEHLFHEPKCSTESIVEQMYQKGITNGYRRSNNDMNKQLQGELFTEMLNTH